ncbi:hypothetical protein FVE85_5957 [Porphyridium purpureum]|uniref:Uncharacterized protein n=1 Tax=Porphyridium purpureum TaxID=35688 RepID=A0A5J4Z5K2_PORPP|nr:hypothetical protein FVE85_5957 [Porphyridium purpureum]|eukprot:POR0455..scf295_1
MLQLACCHAANITGSDTSVASITTRTQASKPRTRPLKGIRLRDSHGGLRRLGSKTSQTVDKEFGARQAGYGALWCLLPGMQACQHWPAQTMSVPLHLGNQQLSPQISYKRTSCPQRCASTRSLIERHDIKRRTSQRGSSKRRRHRRKSSSPETARAYASTL